MSSPLALLWRTTPLIQYGSPAQLSGTVVGGLLCGAGDDRAVCTLPAVNTQPLPAMGLFSPTASGFAPQYKISAVQTGANGVRHCVGMALLHGSGRAVGRHEWKACEWRGAEGAQGGVRGGGRTAAGAWLPDGVRRTAFGGRLPNGILGMAPEWLFEWHVVDGARAACSAGPSHAARRTLRGGRPRVAVRRPLAKRYSDIFRARMSFTSSSYVVNRLPPSGGGVRGPPARTTTIA
jgi:hypothetical protein